MSFKPGADFPNLTEVFSAILARVTPEQQPLLIAIAERLAALRYRAWANDESMRAERQQLLACAAREDEIARRVEEIHRDAADIQRRILEANPDIGDINRGIFAGRPMKDQLAIQAQGERLGAATWHRFAEQESDTSRRDVFLSCAELEEASAVVLDRIVGTKK